MTLGENSIRISIRNANARAELCRRLADRLGLDRKIVAPMVQRTPAFQVRIILDKLDEQEARK